MKQDNKALQNIKNLMIIKYPLFAEQIAKANLIYSTEVPTAGTDGKNIYFNADFFDNLTENDKLFIIAHELLHIRFEHMYRLIDKQGNTRDPETWNMATDAIINANLKRDGFTIPEGGVDIEGALSYNAEQLYDKLIQHKKKNQNQNEQDNENKSQQNNNSQNQDEKNENKSQQGSKSQNQDNKSDNESQKDNNSQSNNNNIINNNQEKNKQNENKSQKDNNGSNKQNNSLKDDHSMWQKAFNEKQNEEKNGNNKQNNSQDKTQNESNDKKDSDNKDNKNDNKEKQDNNNSKQNRINKANNINESSDYDEKKILEENRRIRLEKAKEKLNKVKEIVRQSTITNNEFADLGKSKPVADWKTILKKKFDNDEIIWSQHRYIRENNYAYRMTDFIDENESITEVMLDVSGSIPDSFIKSFLRQLKPILKESKLKVACFDTMVTEFTELKTDRDIDKYYIYRMTGGTDLDLPVRSFTKDPKINKIVFTDGYSYDMPRKDLENVDVIWIVYDNKDFKPCCGKVINVESSEFNKTINLIVDDDSLTK